MADIIDLEQKRKAKTQQIKFKFSAKIVMNGALFAVSLSAAEKELTKALRRIEKRYPNFAISNYRIEQINE